MYRILVPDALTRKAFDIISIISKQFKDIPLIIGMSQKTVWDKLHLDILYKGEVELLRTNRISPFVADLKCISEKYSDDKIIFIPGEEETVSLFYEFLNKYGVSNFVYLLPNQRVFELLRNKRTLNEYCLKHGVQAPKCYTIEELKSLSEDAYPLLLKPSVGSGGKGIYRLYKSCDLTLEIYEKVTRESYTVQELIENGRDVKGAFYLYDTKLIGFYAHERIRTSPPDGGVTVFSKSIHDERLLSEGRKLLDDLHWKGLIMLEFLYDSKTDSYKIIEANPRIWGSILLSEYCGERLLTNYVNICLGRSFEKEDSIQTRYIRWFFPVDLLNYIKTGFSIAGFWSFKNTCFINWTYANKLSAIYYNLISLFRLKNIQRFFRK